MRSTESRQIVSITVGFVFSCLSAWSLEVLGDIDPPAPERALNGVVRSGDGSQALEVKPAEGRDSNQLELSGQGGATRTWEIPAWVRVRYIVFAEGAAWFTIWCEKSGALMPVCLARCSVLEKNEDSFTVFDDTADDFRIRRLISRDDGKLVVFGGFVKDSGLTNKMPSGKMVKAIIATNELRKITWKEVITRYQAQMDRLRSLGQ